ncbi:hypothetical protein GCM10007304_40840 [Rhodococcoides trifolii]|uniref:HNH endonuclease n=1 Tax=Rhodococcoides trifolii TaxID=908250 RepID=A0A917G5L9_9NOCA|nr:hypothetical protein [Rhodococcus trifolii]GGG22868.1 hypothetical protein GCM10007304_40840 [Rhodococcus trifolii]
MDYARIEVIAGVLARASDATVAVLAPDVLAAAHLYNVKALRDTIWELWTDHNPDEAAQARKRNLRDRAGVRRSKWHDGGTQAAPRRSDNGGDEKSLTRKIG